MIFYTQFYLAKLDETWIKDWGHFPPNSDVQYDKYSYRIYDFPDFTGVSLIANFLKRAPVLSALCIVLQEWSTMKLPLGILTNKKLHTNKF